MVLILTVVLAAASIAKGGRKVCCAMSTVCDLLTGVVTVASLVAASDSASGPGRVTIDISVALGTMDFISEIDYSKRPKTRVELHLHLDGSIRYATIWELARKKGIDLGVKSLSECERWLKKTTSTTLADFLKPFPLFIQPFIDDPESWTRIAYELCEDQARDGVAYFEARFAPQLLHTTSKFTTDDVILSVQKGLDKGYAEFGVKAKQVVCCVLENEDWARENLKLCQKYPNYICGIDIAKDQSIQPGYTKTEVQVYQLAAKDGINRTAHAGESGPWTTVEDAMNLLQCQRVGHGYRVFEDTSMKCYEQAKKEGLHFEVCPISSVLTGGCPTWASKHAVVRLAEDNANFSISKDDTTITGSNLDREYSFLCSLGLTEAHLVRANLNGARSCFLPLQEKQSLLKQLEQTYGLNSSGLQASL